jgi:hypothetical protein
MYTQLPTPTPWHAPIRVFYATGTFKPLRFKSKPLKPLEFKFQTKMAYTNGLQRLTGRFKRFTATV